MWLFGRQKIFISYSHQDKRWLDMIRTHLEPFLRNRKISVFADIEIVPGTNWLREIETAITQSRVAILLVSPHFLASGFIVDQELPQILRDAEDRKLKIMWIAVSTCAYQETEIKKYQALNDLEHPLDSLLEHEINKTLNECCEKIFNAISIEPRWRLRRKVKIGAMLATACVMILLVLYYQLFYRLRNVMPEFCPIHLTKAQSNARMDYYFTDGAKNLEKTASLRVYDTESGTMRAIEVDTNALIPTGQVESLHYISDIQMGKPSWTGMFFWTPAFYTSMSRFALSAGSSTHLLLVINSEYGDKLRVGLKDVHEYEHKVTIDLEPGLYVYAIPLRAFDKVDLDRIIFMVLAHEEDYAIESRMNIEIFKFTFVNKGWEEDR